MRTTLTIDDQIAERLKQAALESGKSFKQVVNEVLRAGLQAPKGTQARRYRVRPASLGMPKPGMDLNKALHLADALEDEAITQKLEQRK